MTESETLRELYERKSVRVYEERPVEPETKSAILRAALEAPTAGNMTLYSVIDVTSAELRERLAVSCDNQPFIAKAPLVLIFVADCQRWYDKFRLASADSEGEPPRRPGYGDLLLAVSDALIAAQNCVVAAESLGLGSCYIGDILERYELHRELLSLPKYALPAAMLCIGYPTPGQKARQKPPRPPADTIMFENAYQSPSPERLREADAEQYGNSYDFNSKTLALLSRKWNSDFSREMSRSVDEMLKSWAAADTAL